VPICHRHCRHVQQHARFNDQGRGTPIKRRRRCSLEHRRTADQEPRPTVSDSDNLFRHALYWLGPSLVPASTAVPAAAAEEENDNHDDE
jgi:hypothetical protein